MSLGTLAHCGFLVVTFVPEAVQLCPQSGLRRGASPGAPAWVSSLAVQKQGRHQLETDFMANPDGALSSISQPQPGPWQALSGWARPLQPPELFMADRKIAVVDISPANASSCPLATTLAVRPCRGATVVPAT